jgi:hypothetical protein
VPQVHWMAPPGTPPLRAVTNLALFVAASVTAALALFAARVASVIADGAPRFARGLTSRSPVGRPPTPGMANGDAPGHSNNS